MSYFSRFYPMLAPLLMSVPLPAAEPAPNIELRELPLLFADDSGIAARQGVIRTVHPAHTRVAPVLEADRPWEADRVYIYGSVYYDEPQQLLRMWYLTRLETVPNIGAIGPKGFRANRYDVDLYATSRDGLHWEKPALGLHAFNGSKDNNMIFDLHSPSVLFDPRETNPGKRYKMLGCFKGNYHAAVSPDGLSWTRHPGDEPVLKYADNISLTQSPATGEYLAYHRCPATVRGKPRRVVWLARSKDFNTWSKPELVFAPDEEDDAWTTKPDQRTEVNNMSVLPHAAGFLGLPAIFRVTEPDRRASAPKGTKWTPLPGQSPTDGTIDVQLITSADGRTWQRTEPRVPVIARGKPGSFDAGTILGVSSTAVHVGDETWVYYTGLTTTHGSPIPPKRITIGRAEWRRHGFVSLDAEASGGRVETQPLRLSTPALTINADASRGQVRVALLESDGRPIPGCTLDDCDLLKKDATRWQVQWRAGVKAPTDRTVRVVVELSEARLFSVSCEN